jgi:hypothetical protein
MALLGEKGKEGCILPVFAAGAAHRVPPRCHHFQGYAQSGYAYNKIIVSFIQIMPHRNKKRIA